MADQVRIKDIAKRAGVSAGTVDRVLHERGEVKAETKELVLKIASELNYKPNVAAQLLKKSFGYKVAILIPKPTNKKVTGQSIQRVFKILQEKNLHIILILIFSI